MWFDRFGRRRRVGAARLARPARLIEREGNLKRIGAQVDPNEELAAVTFLASRQPDSPALLFENLVGDATRTRILINMLGASKERYALAVGLDPQLRSPK